MAGKDDRPYKQCDQDDSPDEDLRDELPQEADVAEGEETETVPCPKCKKPVYDDADRCPNCGMNLIKGIDPAQEARGEGKPAGAWQIWVSLLAIAALLSALLYWISTSGK